ncbi:glycine--tRNA ligase [Halobacteriales archaeon SW_7_71_33]|nr:MAG: glycine--tRNA ligase [Halobacteriales archaeon SW_7_71_33]
MTENPAPDPEDADADVDVDVHVRERLVELAKRRGFFFRTAGAYGGAAGFYTFGPEGAALKRAVENAWRDRFAVAEGNVEIDAPTVLPEPVFEASGHLDTFDDMLVECADCGTSHRADHLVEDHADIEEAEGLPPEEIEGLIRDDGVGCPACGTALSGEPVEEFNLMFETAIGPGSGSPGYLRPETAQGIFVDFPRLAEYARGQLPFGVTQVGRAYRNEISPRRSILRVRELTQAELELFVDPEGDGPDLSGVADVELRLLSAEAQSDGESEPHATTVREAVDAGTIENEWIAYYLGVASEWYQSAGVDPDRLRFRQHIAGERAHYAVDCWDAEGEVDGDWIELAGVADRGDYDLSKHHEHADERFTVFRQYDEARTVERTDVDPDMSELGPRYGGDAEAVADELRALAGCDPETLDAESVTVTVDGTDYQVDTDHVEVTTETTTETGEHVVPHVIEPSFGVDRLVYTLLDHAYREDEVEGERRTYLALDPSVAPTLAAVFPLTDDERDRAEAIVAELRAEGFAVEYDDSGNIGRRYRRQDEVGTPFCVTVDPDTHADGTVTLRDRNTTEQVRVPVDALAALLAALRNGDRDFASLAAEYPVVGDGDGSAPAPDPGGE